MRIGDYLRLGVAGVRAQKKRAAMIIVTIGALVSVLAAGCFIIQGVENQAVREIGRESKTVRMGGLKVSKQNEYNPLDLVLAWVRTEGDAETVREGLGTVWMVYGGVCAVLMMIAAIVEASTYARILGQDAKTMALYQAMGATRGQIRRVYMVYLSILSILVGLVAVGAGVGLAAVVSIVNAEELTRAFAVGFGTEARTIWLVGWNWRVAAMAGVVLAGAGVSYLCLFFCKNIVQWGK